MKDTYLDREQIRPYLYDIKNAKSKPLSREEERDLLARIQKGDNKAKEKLILHNLRFVIREAKKFQNQGLELSDLINEGNYGLIIAAERYNYKQSNVKFISYAVWWVKQCIRDALNRSSRLIKIPVNQIAATQKIRQNNADLNEEDATQQLGIPSVDASINDEVDENTELGDLIESDDYLPDDQDENEKDYEIKKEINNCIDILSHREKTIIMAYYGIGEESKTLENITSEYFPDFSKERIRQHSIQAIRKLRDNAFNLIKYLQE